MARLVREPLIGVARDDLRPGLRIIGFRGRAVIVFNVRDETVVILGVYYGGRDYEELIPGIGDLHSTQVPLAA